MNGFDFAVKADLNHVPSVQTILFHPPPALY